MWIVCSNLRWNGRNSAKACLKPSIRDLSRGERGPRMSELHRYFDGRTARPRKVTLAIGPTGIAIRDEDGASLASWPYAHIRVADQNAVSGAFVLRLEPDEAARLEVAAGASWRLCWPNGPSSSAGGPANGPASPKDSPSGARSARRCAWRSISAGRAPPS